MCCYEKEYGEVLDNSFDTYINDVFDGKISIDFLFENQEDKKKYLFKTFSSKTLITLVV